MKNGEYPLFKKIVIMLVKMIIFFMPLALIFYGCWLIYRPSAYIVLGILLWIDLNFALKSAKKPPKTA